MTAATDTAIESNAARSWARLSRGIRAMRAQHDTLRAEIEAIARSEHTPALMSSRIWCALTAANEAGARIMTEEETDDR